MTAAANAVLMVVYGVIAYTIWANLIRTDQFYTNPLGTAMGAIFFVCGVGHGLHFIHTLLPLVGADLEFGLAARVSFSDPRLMAWDVATAAVGIWYITLRGRFKVVWRGAAMFDDMREREKQALDLHDGVVQGLAKAKLAIDLGRKEEALEHIETTLADSKRIITDILGSEDSEAALGVGDLQRRPIAD